MQLCICPASRWSLCALVLAQLVQRSFALLVAVWLGGDISERSRLVAGAGLIGWYWQGGKVAASGYSRHALQRLSVPGCGALCGWRYDMTSGDRQARCWASGTLWCGAVVWALCPYCPGWVAGWLDHSCLFFCCAAFAGASFVCVFVVLLLC